MAKFSTCKQCGIKIENKEEVYKYKNKSYCKNCYDKYIKELEQESLDYKDLIDYICKSYRIKSPTGIMLKELKQMRTECNYKYPAIKYTIWYYSNILGKSLDVKYNLSFVKYNYEKAKDYYMQQEQIRESVKDNAKCEIKTKIIKQKNIDYANENKSKSLLIDLSKLSND